MVREGWKRYKVGELGTFAKGSGISREQSDTGRIPAVRYGELYTTHNYYIRDFSSHVSSEIASQALKIKYGNILFTCSGETKEEIGKCVAIVTDEEAYAGGDLIVLTPAIQMNPLFLGYALNVPSVVRQRAQLAQGDAIVHISADSIKSIEFDAPDFPEQCYIAQALSDIDELIFNLEKLIKKKKNVREGAMQELLTGRKRLPGFNGKWIETEINKCGIFVGGNGFPLKKQGETIGKYPFYKVSDFSNQGNDRFLKKANNYISQSVADELSCNIIPKQSIVFAKIGAAIFLERKKMTTTPCCIDNNMLSFQPYESVSPYFMWFIFQRIALGNLVEATALPSLNGKVIGDALLQIPNERLEQDAIGKVINDMDSEIEYLNSKLEKYRQIRSGMMNELLTGKIRLV